MLSIPRETIKRTLRRDEMQPFDICPVQELLPGDFERCIRFCKWLTNATQLDRQHLKMFLLTDEPTFTQIRLLNVRNEHI